MTGIRIHPSGRVECRAALDLPLPPAVVWGQLRDFRRFASHDTFHATVDVEGGVTRAGARLTLVHRYLAFEVRRVGRIARWCEWQPGATRAGYSFSDLSAVDPRRGFPHVFTYRLAAAAPGRPHASRLEIIVRGRWTARLVPRWAARLWLAWVLAHVVANVRNALLAVAVVRQIRPAGRTNSAAP